MEKPMISLVLKAFNHRLADESYNPSQSAAQSVLCKAHAIQIPKLEGTHKVLLYSKRRVLLHMGAVKICSLLINCVSV